MEATLDGKVEVRILDGALFFALFLISTQPPGDHVVSGLYCDGFFRTSLYFGPNIHCCKSVTDWLERHYILGLVSIVANLGRSLNPSLKFRHKLNSLL